LVGAGNASIFFSELFFLLTAIEFYLFGNCKSIDGFAGALDPIYTDGEKF
jgi:hypothetical protein